MGRRLDPQSNSLPLGSHDRDYHVVADADLFALLPCENQHDTLPCGKDEAADTPRLTRKGLMHAPCRRPQNRFATASNASQPAFHQALTRGSGCKGVYRQVVNNCQNVEKTSRAVCSEKCTPGRRSKRAWRALKRVRHALQGVPANNPLEAARSINCDQAAPDDHAASPPVRIAPSPRRRPIARRATARDGTAT